MSGQAHMTLHMTEGFFARGPARLTTQSKRAKGHCVYTLLRLNALSSSRRQW